MAGRDGFVREVSPTGRAQANPRANTQADIARDADALLALLRRPDAGGERSAKTGPPPAGPGIGSGAGVRAGAGIPGAQAPSRGASALPTPGERADLAVLEIERLIRDHRSRTLAGMRMADWKSAARQVILETLIDSERSLGRHHLGRMRWILVSSATVVSVGFWSAVYLVDKAQGTLAAVLLAGGLLVGGVLVMDLAVRRLLRRLVVARRHRRWQGIRSFDRRINVLRRHLDKTLKDLEEVSDDAKRLRERLRSPEG